MFLSDKRKQVPGKLAEHDSGAAQQVLAADASTACFWPYKKLDVTSCLASIKKPAEWDAIISFANHPRPTFEEVRNNRPPKEKVEKALDAYLEQIKLRNCEINEGYLKALGLR